MVGLGHGNGGEMENESSMENQSSRSSRISGRLIHRLRASITRAPRKMARDTYGDQRSRIMKRKVKFLGAGKLARLSLMFSAMEATWRYLLLGIALVRSEI